MDLTNIKLPIGIIAVIVVQAFGIIWYVAQLDSTVTGLDASVADMQEQATTVDIAVLQTDVDNLKGKIAELDEISSEEFDPSELEELIDELEERIDDVETTQAVIDNEMRTIMSDHGGFAEVLKELNEAGLLPSGEKREYGGYN